MHKQKGRCSCCLLLVVVVVVCCNCWYRSGVIEGIDSFSISISISLQTLCAKTCLEEEAWE